MADELSGNHLKTIFEELAKLNAAQQAGFLDSMKAFASELRKPTDVEQAKMDKEKADLARKLHTRVLVAQAEEQRKVMLKNGCDHSMPDGKHLWRAQANQDGYFRPMCMKCNTELPKIKCSVEQLTGQINLGAYAIDMGQLEKWAEHTKLQDART